MLTYTPRTSFSPCREDTAYTPRSCFSLCREGRVCTLRSCFHLPLEAGLTLRAVAFHVAVGAGSARRTAVFPLAVRAGVAYRAFTFQLAVRARIAVVFQTAMTTWVAYRAAVFPLAVRASISSHCSRSVTSFRSHSRANVSSRTRNAFWPRFRRSFPENETLPVALPYCTYRKVPNNDTHPRTDHVRHAPHFDVQAYATQAVRVAARARDLQEAPRVPVQRLPKTVGGNRENERKERNALRPRLARGGQLC